MKRPRDSQRKKVYTAERAAFIVLYQPLDDNSIEGVRRYVKQVIESKRWATLALRYDYPSSNITMVAVKDGRGRRRACGGTWHVSLPVYFRSKPIILHELAHTLTIHQQELPIHGWLFCRAYLDLVSTFIGADAKKKLKASFRDHKVKTNPKRR
jgi:putative metallohydrolase (TIGR04338 family)